MDTYVFIIIVGIAIVLALILPHFLRQQRHQHELRALKKAIKDRGKQAVLEEIDIKISDKLTYIATLDANAGAIYGAGGDEVMDMAHRELRSLKRSRDIAANYRE